MKRTELSKIQKNNQKLSKHYRKASQQTLCSGNEKISEKDEYYQLLQNRDRHELKMSFNDLFNDYSRLKFKYQKKTEQIRQLVQVNQQILKQNNLLKNQIYDLRNSLNQIDSPKAQSLQYNIFQKKHLKNTKPKDISPDQTVTKQSVSTKINKQSCFLQYNKTIKNEIFEYQSMKPLIKYLEDSIRLIQCQKKVDDKIKLDIWSLKTLIKIAKQGRKHEKKKCFSHKKKSSVIDFFCENRSSVQKMGKLNKKNSEAKLQYYS